MWTSSFGSRPVDWIGRDAEGEGHCDRLVGAGDVEPARGDGAADPLGDLEGLLPVRLGQEDRELLAAETGGDVVVAKLLPEHLGNAGEHLVADEVAVCIVHFAEEVEVGHDQRCRAIERSARASSSVSTLVKWRGLKRPVFESTRACSSSCGTCSDRWMRKGSGASPARTG